MIKKGCLSEVANIAHAVKLEDVKRLISSVSIVIHCIGVQMCAPVVWMSTYKCLSEIWAISIANNRSSSINQSNKQHGPEINLSVVILFIRNYDRI